jgi:hypothetical protein
MIRDTFHQGGLSMYLSAERLALANQTVRETFEETCVAWQAIPHWDTGDPGQSTVRADDIDNPAAPPIVLAPIAKPFTVSVAQAISPTPDALLAQVMAKTVELSQDVDDLVLPHLRAKAKGTDFTIAATGKPQDVLDKLIPARARVEDEGYRAPSCLITNTPGLVALTQLDGGYSVLESLLTSANVNSLHRAKKIDGNAAANNLVRILLLGRRQRIAHGGGPNASSGEEPVDLAVSVFPSLEVVGETATNLIDLAVRIRFATRIKDAGGIAVLKKA